ncbi:hypothetical protein O3G_MSEX013876 [Manduca sexta]|uniref:Microtubule-actin cross-linking factor 1 n=1 Tax=Manduca sexta TaxID=7130 RepID=A0A921ZT77_MANSE|nr:hypothetical protein O3G_MSEX013876 [Manduca sexta]
MDGQTPHKSMANGKLTSPTYATKTVITEDDRPDVRKLKRVHRMYEGPNIIESRGIVHPETREILTVGQAISMRILDVRTGRLLSSPDTRQTMTIEQAAQEGLIDPKLAARLTGPCGMTEDGNEVTLLEAIQRELYDAEQGLTDPAEKRIKVTVEGDAPGQGMSISDALNRGQVDLQRGLYRLPNGSYITIAEAYQRGYLIYNEIIKIKSSALSLSDAISQELVDNSGWILDRNSGEKFQIDVAIENELINPNIREIVDPKNDTKITLAEAIEKNIINVKISKYVHNVTKEKFTFKEAAVKRYICKPMTLKDVCDNNLMTNDGKILSPANRVPLNILEAISVGVLDSDSVKCITDTTTGQLLTLSEALANKIILHDNKFRDNLTGEICTVPEAVDRGLITSVSQRSIFDIDGFRDPKTGEFISFNLALSKGNFKYANGETFLKSESGDFVYLEDCTKVAIVRPEVLEMFNRKIGVYENGKELSVLDAVFKNILDPKTGHLLDATTKKPIPFNKAVEINMITPEGAALLNSLLNITLTLQTVTKTVKRYVTVTNTSATQRSETIITFAEAIRRGLIDENTQTFTDPTTGTVFPIQQALDEGLLGVEKNEPRVVHISDRVSKKDIIPGQVVELKITKKSFIKDMPPSPESKVERDSRPETVKSPDYTIREISQPREGLHEIRTITTKSVVTEPTVTSMTIKKNTIELPSGGWTLKDAIQQNLFDPSTGMLVIPGTDRILDLEEAVKLNIINPESVKVLDPKTRKEVPLDKALELRIIDNVGRYKYITETITMVEAIERKYIIFIHLIKSTSSQKVITITSVAGMPDKMEISEMTDIPQDATSEDQSALEPVQVAHGVIFDPSTALVISTTSGVSENILEAVDRGVVPYSSVKVVEPNTGRAITLKEAMNRGIVDNRTGEYRDSSGKKISLVDAAKVGLLVVVGAPLVAATKVIQVVKSTMVVDPQTGENIPMEVAFERGLVDAATYKKYEESIRDRTPETDSEHDVKTTVTEKVTVSQYTTTTSPAGTTTVTVVVDPVTGERLPIEVAYERGLIDPISYKKYELSVKDRSPETATYQDIKSPSTSSVTFTQVTKSTPETVVTTVVDPRTGKQISMDVAFERGLIDAATYKLYKESIEIVPGSAKTAPGTSTVTISQTTSKPLSVGAAVSEGFITVEAIQNSLSAENRRPIEAITAEKKARPSDVIQIIKTNIKPKYKINIARESTPERPILESKPIVLQKLRKRVMTPQDALEKCLLDKETAKVLEAVKIYKDENGSPITLGRAIEIGLVDENKGKITDPVRGDIVTIKEALKRGILDADGQDEVLIPLARALSIPEVLEQGLLDPVTGKIIHPETGSLLTLREAIICEIVDPLTSVIVAPGKKVTLEEAIERNLIDNDKNVVKTTDGPLDLVAAVNARVFPETEPLKSFEEIPPAAMTLNIAIKKHLINPHTGEIKHPLTSEIIPLDDAVKRDLIMAIPYPQSSQTVTLEKALETGAVNLKHATFTRPDTQEVIPIDKALEEGLLAVKQSIDSGVVTTITETFTSQHTITTKMIELLADYVLVSAHEVKNTKTGEIISMEEARRKGIVRDEQTSKEQFITSDTNISFEDALNLGYINIEAGTFTHPKTGETVSISEAVSSGILNTEVPSDSGKSSPKRKELEMLDLNEAFELLFDDKTQKFRDPKSPNKVITFKEALERNVINPESVIYNVEAGKPVTLQQALDTGLIDKKTGKLKEPKTGKSVDIKNAAKMGLIAVVAAPVLAGMAVVQGAKTVTSKIIQPKPEKAIEAPSKVVPADKIVKHDVITPKEKPGITKPGQVEPVKEHIIKSTVIEKPSKVEPLKPIASKKDIQTIAPKEVLEDVPEKELTKQKLIVKEEKLVSDTIKSVTDLLHSETQASAIEQKTIVRESKSPIDLSDVDKIKPADKKDTKPVVQEFRRVTPEGEEIVTILKKSISIPFGTSDDEIAPKSEVTKATEELPSHTQIGKPHPTLQVEDAIVKDMSEATKEKLPKGVVTPSDKQRPVQEGTTIQEIRETTPDGEVTTIIKKIVTTSEPTQYVTEHKSTVTTTTSSKFTTVEISQDGSKSYVVTEETTDPRDVSETILQGEQVHLIKTPDETDRVDVKPTQLVQEKSPVKEVLTLDKPVKEQPKDKTSQSKPDSLKQLTPETDKVPQTVIEVAPGLLYDPKTSDVISATTGETADLLEAVNKGNIPSENVKVIEPTTGKEITLKEAIKKGIVDEKTGEVKDKSGKKVTVADAAKIGLIAVVGAPILAATKIIDVVKSAVTDPKTSEKVIKETVTKSGTQYDEYITVHTSRDVSTSEVTEVVRSFVIIDPKTGEQVPIEEAHERGLVDPETYKEYQQITQAQRPDELTTTKVSEVVRTIYIEDPKTGEKVLIEEALERGIIDEETYKEYKEAAKSTTPTESVTTKVTELVKTVIIDPKTGEKVPLEEALNLGIIDEETYKQYLEAAKTRSPTKITKYTELATTLIVDPKTGEKIPLEDALKQGLIDEETYKQYKDVKSSQELESTTAQLIKTVIVDPKTGEKVPLEEALRRGLIDEETYKQYKEVSIISSPSKSTTTVTDLVKTVIVDPKTGEKIPLEEAVSRGLIDEETYKQYQGVTITGTRTDTVTTQLTEFVKTVIVDPKTGEKLALDEALNRGLIDKDTYEQYKATEKTMTPSESVTTTVTGVVKTIVFIDPKTGEKVDIEEAHKRGLIDEDTYKQHKDAIITESPTKISKITDVVKTVIIVDPKTGEKVPLDDALQRGLIDHATYKQYQESTKAGTPQDFEIKTSDVISSVLIVDPNTGEKVPLDEALKRGLIDPDTYEQYVKAAEAGTSEAIMGVTEVKKVILIVDPKTGEKIPIDKALELGLIDSETYEKFVNAASGDEPSDLSIPMTTEVVKTVLVEDPKTGEKIPLEEAVKRGIIDEPTGKKVDEAIKANVPEDQLVKMIPRGITFTQEVVERHVTSKTITRPGEIVITETTQIRPTITESITTVEQKVLEFEGPTHTTIHDGKTVSAMLIDAERQPLRIIDEITEQNVTKEKAIPVKPLYENIPLIDAIAQGKIEPKVCRIIVNGVESPLTVQDSLEQEQISRFSPVDVMSKNCVVLRESKPSYCVAISHRLTPEELSEMGVYDIEKGIFLNPETGAKISFEELVYGLQIFDPESILVKDLGSKSDNYISFDEAIARPIIDKTTGHMVNPKTGKRVPFLECIQLGWIVEKPEDVSVPEQVTIESAFEQGIYNPKTLEITDVKTGELVPIGKAVEKGLVDQESLLVRVPRTNEAIPLSDAIDRGDVKIEEGVITVTETREVVEVSVAIKRGVISISRRAISIEAVIVNEMYESKSGKIIDRMTDQMVTVGDAVDRNIIHPTISEIKDTASEKFVSLAEALDKRIIDPETGRVRDIKTGKDIPLDDALKKGLVATKAVTFSLFDIIELGYYNPETGKVLNPKTGKIISLKQAIDENLVDPTDVTVKDDKTESVVPFDQAVKSGLVDLEQGIITSPVTNLKDALDKGYLLSDKKPWTLQEGLVQGIYDPETGLLTINNKTMTLDDAIKIGNIDPEALTIRNSVTGEIITLADAIKIGIIDSREGKFKDPIHGNKISLTDASERGLILPAKRKLSLPEAVFKGFYDPKTGKFTHPQSKDKIQMDRAIRKRMIDPQSTLVHVAGKVLPFEFAVDRGIIDSRTGTILLGDEKVDFREAFERGILVEVRKPLSLVEAIDKGVYNEITGMFMDPQSGKKYTLAEAIRLNLIDAHSVHIQDNRLGKWDKITLPESLESGVIDDQTGKIRNINNDNEEITLRKAFEIGLLVDSKAPISLQRALHQGLYDDTTGKIIDPATNRKITLHEAIRRSIISPKYLCYFDKKSEKPLSLAECCRSEIIDRRSGKFHEPGSDVQIPLSEAMSLGLVVDIESASFTLYETLAMDMYDITELIFVHPVSERKISLKTAIEEELVNPQTSLVKHIPSSKYIKLDEAIQSGIIDDENNVYVLPNGNQINLLDAKHRGLIVTTKKNLSLEEIIRNGLFRADNGKIVDPNTNEFVDINKAIEIGLLNPESTVVKDSFTNKFNPLPLAIQRGDVDVAKGRVLDTKAKKTFSLDIAFDKGLLVTVIQPITSQTVTRRYVTDSAASKEPVFREFTLDEAIKYEFIDPETAVIKDPHKNKYIPLKLGISEGIIDKNAKGSFDTQNRARALCFVFENGLIVYVREPLTFEQAIEDGHLNVATARFTDPHSNEVLTIKDATSLGYIDADTALIKDNLKKRLVKLPEAFRKGLMDAEKGNILDTETSKLHTLTAAIESGLLMTPKKSFSLIETVNFGIYNPTTGALNDPFITTSVMDRKRLSLGEAIQQGIVDASSTVVKDPETGKIWPLVQAIEQKLVDPVEGRLIIDPTKGISLDLVKALKKGYLLPAETRPLPAMLKNPFELNRECLPVRDHINDDIDNNHRFAKYLTSHNHFVLRVCAGYAYDARRSLPLRFTFASS